MTDHPTPSPDPALAALLRRARPAPGLPPRFQERVWRRLETARATPENAAPHWLELLVSRMLRPRWLMAASLAMVLVAATAGAWQGVNHARLDAQHRYLASVNPDFSQP